MKVLNDLTSERNSAVEYTAEDLELRLRTAAGPIFLNEYFSAGTATKVYFDFDKYLDHEPPEAELREDLRAAIADAGRVLVAAGRTSDMPEPDFAIASRHGIVQQRNQRKHKVSFRLFTTNYAVPDYVRIGRLLKGTCLDSSPYKASEQLLNLVLCRKRTTDPRVLRPLDGHEERPLHHFFATHLTGSEIVLDKPAPPTPRSRKAPATDTTPTRPTPTERERLAPLRRQVVALLDRLGDSRWDDRQSWINVGIALKNAGAGHGDSDLFKDLFLQFSRKSSKFLDDATEGRTWDSLCNSDHDGPALTMSSLDDWASIDSPQDMGAMHAALAIVGFKDVPKLQPEGPGEFSFLARNPFAKCPCCHLSHGSNPLKWFLAKVPDGELQVSLRADVPDCCARVVAPLKDFLETSLRSSRLPSLLDADNIEVLEKTSDDVQPALLAKDSNGQTSARMSLPITEVTYSNGTRKGVFELLGNPPLDDMVLNKGGVDASGWSGNGIGTKKMTVVNAGATAKLDCDWTNPPFGKLERATLSYPGKRLVISERDKSDIAKIQDIVTRGMVQHLCNTLEVDELVARTLLNYNVITNVGQVNIYNYNSALATEAEDSSIRPTCDLADELHDKGAFVNCIQLGNNEWAVFDTSTGMWALNKSRDHAARIVQKIVKQWRNERSEVFTPKEYRHLLNVTNMSMVLRNFCGELYQDGVVGKFDETFEAGSVPFRNGMFVSSAPDAASTDEHLRFVCRPFEREDYVTTTLGYDFVPLEKIASEDCQFVKDFYGKVLPRQDERRVVQQLMGFALFGDASIKHFLLLTDLRGGYNGKSTLLKFVYATFGNLVRKDRQILVNAVQEDPNAHQTGMLYFKGKRLCWVEEPNENSKIDIAKLKDIAGGRSTFEGRAPMSATNVSFMWRAFVVITANENKVPLMEAAGDRAFLDRFVVIHMRSKFVTPDNPELKDEPYTYLQDSAVEERLLSPGCIAAHVHFLFQGYSDFLREGKVVKLPPDSKAFLDRIMFDADPVMEHVVAFIKAKCRLENGAFTKKTEVERSFGEFLDSDINTIRFNKEKRKRNSVLKAALMRKGVSLVSEIKVGEERHTDVYRPLSIVD
jgi:phage/plasmid-associated DNA primase